MASVIQNIPSGGGTIDPLNEKDGTLLVLSWMKRPFDVRKGDPNVSGWNREHRNGVEQLYSPYRLLAWRDTNRGGNNPIVTTGWVRTDNDFDWFNVARARQVYGNAYDIRDIKNITFSYYVTYFDRGFVIGYNTVENSKWTGKSVTVSSYPTSGTFTVNINGNPITYTGGISSGDTNVVWAGSPYFVSISVNNVASASSWSQVAYKIWVSRLELMDGRVFTV